MISNPAGRLAGDLKGTPSGKVPFIPRNPMNNAPSSF